MGIHQALIGGYPLSLTWRTAALYAGDSSFDITAASLEPNDLLVFVQFADISSPSLRDFGTFSPTTLVSNNLNSIRTRVSYFIVPLTPAQISGQFVATDAGLIISFRRTGSPISYNLSLVGSNQTSTSPSHNNTPISFSEDDLALLLAFVDDDSTPMAGPTDSINIAQNQSNNGSLGAAYKPIDSAGNYSWGSWTTLGTDSTLAYVIKIQEA